MQKGHACRQAGFAPVLILVGILVIMVVAGGAYFFGKSQVPKLQTQDQIISQTPQPTSIPSSIPATNPAPTGAGETANWKKYTHPLGFFSFKLPVEWSQDLKGGHNPIGFYNFDTNKFSLEKSPLFDQEIMKIEIYLDTIPMALRDYVAEDKRESIELHGKEIERTWVEASIILGGQPAIKVSDSRGGFRIYVQDPSKSIIIILSFSPNFDQNKDLANQILSTFKFIN